LLRVKIIYGAVSRGQFINYKYKIKKLLFY